MNRHNFDSVKLNDALLVTTYPGYGKGNPGYYKGVVIHVTKTRFTIQFNGDRQQTYNKVDGSEYPRRTGYGNAAPDVSPLTDDGLLLIRKHQMANKARHLAGKLDDIFGNANYREKIVNVKLSMEEIEANIAVLQQAYEAFKKFLPEDQR